MLQISDKAIEALLNGGVHKEMRVYFPDFNKTDSNPNAEGLTLYNPNIEADSFEMKESLMSGSTLSVIGCIATTAEINLYVTGEGILKKLKGQKIEIYLKPGEEEEIPLFTGYVDSAKRTNRKKIKHILAYDKLYQLADKVIYDWFKEKPKTTIRQLLIDLCAHVGLELSDNYYLPNGGFDAFCKETKYASISKQYSAVDLFKAICQINGVFGKIGRDGKFTTLKIDTSTTSVKAYPSELLFPNEALFPGLGTDTPTARIATSKSEDEPPKDLLPYYKELEFEDYTVNKITKVTIQNDANEEEPSYYGDGDNNYIVQGNILAADQLDRDLVEMAANIYKSVANLDYIPFEIEAPGYCWFETGDTISVYDSEYDSDTGEFSKQVIRHFCVLSRKYKGVQLMEDEFSAEGEEDIKVITTDLSSTLSEITSNILRAVSVAVVPVYWDKKTIYFLRKDVEETS